MGGGGCFLGFFAHRGGGGGLRVFSRSDVITLFETGMQIESVKHVVHFYFKTTVMNTLIYHYCF